MIKLFTLRDLSAFSSDAVYKAFLTLDSFGVSDETSLSFDSYEELLDSADIALSSGDYIVAAVESNDFASVKHLVSAHFGIDEVSSPVIAEAVSRNFDDRQKFDMEEQCSVPESCDLHLSEDGLYSGFSLRIGNGVFTLIPLDFARIDSVLDSYVSTYLYLPVTEPKTTVYTAEEETDTEEEVSYKEPVSKMVYSLVQFDKTVTIATSEATMWIYNLYDKIDNLSDVVNFVEVIDDEEETAEKETKLAEENDGAEEEKEAAEKESTAARTIRHAMEARANMDSDFGAAISDVQCSTNEDGETCYFAFVAVADKKTTKVKKINTFIEEEAGLLLPHCVTVLSETVCQKVDAIRVQKEEKAAKKKTDGKKPSKEMIIIAAIVLFIAIISPILIVNSVFKDSTTQPAPPVIATGDVVTTTAPPVITTSPTEPTTLFPGITDIAQTTLSPTDPAEPPASEVTNLTTSPNVSSTKGTFTFYVFGYGHGVGMSQAGANYLASQGWNYAQILANYYYGTTLVSGDTYPQTIKYNGTEYKTRDYLAGVIEGEMGSSFHKEALKAQAVAAYTFAKYYGYSLTTDSNAYKPSPSQACYDAVDEIMRNGLYIAYGGQTALTPFHSISAGLTTSYYNAWGGTALPYLRGGRPSYGDYNAPDFKSTYTVSSDELKRIITSKNLGISLSGDPATWISVLSHDACINDQVGYVASVSVGDKILSGNEFRIKVLEGKIRSHCFMVVYTPDAV